MSNHQFAHGLWLAGRMRESTARAPCGGERRRRARTTSVVGRVSAGQSDGHSRSAWSQAVARIPSSAIRADGVWLGDRTGWWDVIRSTTAISSGTNPFSRRPAKNAETP
jgi:hypothetical protein